MRILVTGARDWKNRAILEKTLDSVVDDSMSDITLVHGAAAGADTMAAEWAAKKGIRREPHPALWNMYGKAAGPIRNSEMVNSKADICVAFLVEGSRGTADCLKKAQRAGIPTIVVKP